MAGVLYAVAPPAVFSILTIPGIKFFFDTADVTNIVVSGAYSQLTDLSGNVNHATQSTSGKRPTVQTAAQNGLDTARLTGASSQMMTLTSSVTLSAGFTLFSVCKRGGPAGSNLHEFVGLSTSDYPWFEWYSDQHLDFGGAGIAKQVSSTSTVTDSIYVLVVMRWDGATTYSIRKDGVEVPFTGPSSISGTSSTIDQIGAYHASIYTNGEIAALAMSTSYLTGSDLSAVEVYLQQRWGTTPF